MSKLILVADDDDMIRAMLRSTFEEAGFEVAEASDGAAAVQAARQRRPALLILDIFMPIKDGFETLRELDDELPVFVISGTSRGYGTASYLATAGHMGASQTFSKPFDPLEVLAAAQELFAAPLEQFP